MHESKWTLRIEVSTNLPDYFTEENYVGYSMHARLLCPLTFRDLIKCDLWGSMVGDMSNWVGNVGGINCWARCSRSLVVERWPSEINLVYFLRPVDSIVGRVNRLGRSNSCLVFGSRGHLLRLLSFSGSCSRIRYRLDIPYR